MSRLWRNVAARLLRNGNDGATEEPTGAGDEAPEEEALRSPSGGSDEYGTISMIMARPRRSTMRGGDVSAGSVGFESSEEDGSTARLSRRSSVLIDLFSLFRRSSSIGTRNLVMRPHDQRLGENDDEYDSDEEEPQVMSKEKLLEAIRQKKEIIGKLRCQAWSMKRKRRTLKVAQRHLQRQEAKVSRVHLYKVEAVRRFTAFARWLDNMKIYLIPWEAKIKRIESHFGSVVSSYFTFLRWVLGVNVTMTIIMLLFVIIPEWLADSRADPVRFNRTSHIKVMPDDVRARADELNTVWDFGGYFQYSLLFYGFYSSETFFGDTVQYRVPIAYFIVNLFVLGYSFFTILRKMAANARSSKLTGGKAEQYVFNWKTFAGWDYSIGNAETAGNFIMANVIKFREAIAEYNVNVKKKFACVQIILRAFANMVIFTMLALSVWAILAVSQITEKDTFIKQNAVSITVSFITLIFPNIFELIGKMERYHPRFALRLQLARVLCLYIVNYYTLIVSLMFMLNALEAKMKANEMTYHLANNGKSLVENTYYEVAHQRMARQILQDIHGPNHLNDTHGFTSPLPPEPPTTSVFSDFGPLIVHNPKVIVSSATNKTRLNTTIFTTRKVGKHDWGNHNRSDHETVVLSYNTTADEDAHTIYAQPRLAGNYDDLCWETLIGQEITKLVNMDLLMTIAAILVIDFLRGLWVRYCNTWWFWNLECTFPEYGEFKVAENVLHLVNNQGMIWLGLFFVPMLPALNNIKLIILMYIRGWAVMTCNVPARQIFRASRSSNFYLMLLLLMLFLCTLPVGYVIASKKPSKNCGPFGRQERFYSILTEVIQNNLNRNLVDAIKYMVSPGIVVPILLLLLLIIYFLFALVRGLREANTDLSNQLMHERTEEKKKIFELAGGGRRRHNGHGHQNGVAFGHDKKKRHHFESSDDDSHGARSLPRSIDGRRFVPSLGSLNEVENTSDGEDENDPHQQLLAHEPPEKEEDALARVKLNWKENFLVCIGLADPKKLKAKKLLEEDVEASKASGDSQPVQEEHELLSYDDRSRSSGTEGTVGSEEDQFMEDERTPMMEKSASALNSWRTAEDRSFRTKSSRSSLDGADEVRPLAGNNWLLAPHPARRAISMQERHRLTPIKTQEHAQSTAQLAHRDVDLSLDHEDLARRSNMNLLQSSDEERRDATRPPTEENSFRDPTPINFGLGDDPRLEYANPYSSYAAAMVSPVISDGDRTFMRPQPSVPPSPRSPVKTPRFRISSSPPRRRISSAQSGGETTATDSDASANRQFLLRVTQPPTPKSKKKEDQQCQQTTV
ncbi:hypothetical protein QR680_018771 [Steinernema hermaphroditum]|uniref:TMC domain-containing protein n=1 Tax=Steinernema hermaphroditum TaxID=289476 RepID=A0AA39HIY0_9BILA|nr:hypothetical protein QR680_018771 [Steinernema hermaphroditum]